MKTFSDIGTIPMTTSAIVSLFPEIRAGGQKIRTLEKNGMIIRLKRGLYVFNPEVTGKIISTELIANHIYSPSYISMSYALRFYGLIPEEVYVIQSMTLKHTRKFVTPIGTFCYTNMPRSVFSVGLTSIVLNGYSFIIASPEKALCDLISHSSGAIFKTVKEALQYLEDDIRLDMNEFYKFRIDIFRQYAENSKKSQSIMQIVKLLNNGK